MVCHFLMIAGRAEAFNDFFKSIHKDHSNCVIDLNALIPPGVTEQLSHVTVSFDKGVVILRSLDTKKAIGCDKLPTIVLKECAYSLAPSITAIINFSLNKGIQLSGWKKANVPPIFEKWKREFVDDPLLSWCYSGTPNWKASKSGYKWNFQ